MNKYIENGVKALAYAAIALFLANRCEVLVSQLIQYAILTVHTLTIPVIILLGIVTLWTILTLGAIALAVGILYFVWRSTRSSRANRVALCLIVIGILISLAGGVTVGEVPQLSADTYVMHLAASISPIFYLVAVWIVLTSRLGEIQLQLDSE